ncbi:uncharacterized protein LOC131178450 [Hevea brasiliensis]|uniref:uncharacterized protein LOC131178450 n=1 Tax=Hevea brasiliensis TaxID=3981 RepID=UPI0025D580B2|nr:uncharacterized protein LOC131178450 [Hevea brasiliensis]
MEEVVAKEERVEAITINPKFVFRGLKTLVLRQLEELRCFYSEKHSLECTQLKTLRVYGCKKLKTFNSESQEILMDGQESQLKIQVPQPLFAFREIVGNLEQLALNNEDIAMIQQSHFPIDLFFKLKILLLQSFYDASVNLPFNILQKFPNLEKLVLSDCYFRELLPHGVVGEDAGVLLQSQIRFLKLDFLRNIRHIWNQDCQPVPFLQNLETLEIWSCDGLTNLAPSSATFKNLTILIVWKCQGLLSLISSSTAKSMGNLTTMIVRESHKVEEIVSNDRNDSQSQSEIVLWKLRTLKLLCLKSLSSFCSSANCTLKFPSLEEVIVTQCPKMKIFSQGAISAPKLKRVNLTEERDKWRWIGNLNSTIIQLYTEKVGFSGLQHLELSQFPELKAVWQDKLPFNFFHNLSRLVVDECMFPSSSVPSGLLPILNNLDKLEVRNCDFMKEVFGTEWENANSVVGHLSKLNELDLINLPMLRRLWIEVPNGILDLRNLKLLKIHNCSSLRNIFTPTICSRLEQLQVLEVKSCAMVKAIITEGVAKEESMEEIIFPLLNSITLESSPNLINFKSGSGTVDVAQPQEVWVVRLFGVSVRIEGGVGSVECCGTDGTGWASGCAMGSVFVAGCAMSECGRLNPVLDRVMYLRGFDPPQKSPRGQGNFDTWDAIDVCFLLEEGVEAEVAVEGGGGVSYGGELGLGGRIDNGETWRGEV